MNHPKPSSRSFWGAILFGIFASVFILFGSSPIFSQNALDQFGYLPLVKNDPTLTPSATPTSTATPAPTSTPNGCVEPSAIASGSEDNETDILDAINVARDSDDKEDLNRAEELTQAARRHSRDMMLNNFVSNVGSEGDFGPERIRDQCYFLADDQEIVWGGTYTEATSLIDTWLKDQFWERAMLDADMIDYGAGFIVNNGSGEFDHYITVSFARREVPATATPTPTNTQTPTPEPISTLTSYDGSNPPTPIAEACVLSHDTENGSGSLYSRDPELCTAALQDALESASD